MAGDPHHKHDGALMNLAFACYHFLVALGFVLYSWGFVFSVVFYSYLEFLIKRRRAYPLATDTRLSISQSYDLPQCELGYPHLLRT